MAHLGAMSAQLGGYVGGWSVVVCVCGFGVGGLALVGRGLCLQVWHGWVGVGQWWFVLWGGWVGVGRSWFVREGLGLVGWGMLADLEATLAHVGAMLAPLGAMGWWSVVVCAFGFGVGGLGLVGRGLRLQVWHGWVGVGQWWFVLWGWWVGVGRSWFAREGLGLVGWGWSVVVCAFRFGVGGLGLVGRGLCLQVWHGWVEVGQWGFRLWGWWVGVGRSWFVHEGLGLVGWGWSAVVCAVGFGVGGLGLVGRSLRLRVWGWWVVVCGEGSVGRRSWWRGRWRRWRVWGLGFGSSVCACGLRAMSPYVGPSSGHVLGLVGRGLCVKVWGWWVGACWPILKLRWPMLGLCWPRSGLWVGGQWWFVLSGLALVGWDWSVVVCACRYGMGGLG